MNVVGTAGIDRELADGAIDLRGHGGEGQPIRGELPERRQGESGDGRLELSGREQRQGLVPIVDAYAVSLQQIRSDQPCRARPRSPIDQDVRDFADVERLVIENRRSYAEAASVHYPHGHGAWA